jgi:hypothetical protein
LPSESLESSTFWRFRDSSRFSKSETTIMFNVSYTV